MGVTVGHDNHSISGCHPLIHDVHAEVLLSRCLMLVQQMLVKERRHGQGWIGQIAQSAAN